MFQILQSECAMWLVLGTTKMRSEIRMLRQHLNPAAYYFCKVRLGKKILYRIVEMGRCATVHHNLWFMGRNATEFASIIYNIRGGKGNTSVILAQQLLKLSPSFSSVDIEIDKFRRSDFFLWDIISSKNASTDLVNELKYAGRASSANHVS